MKYRQKPVTVVAYPWHGDECHAKKVGWIYKAYKSGRIVFEKNGTLQVLNESMVGLHARVGDMLVLHLDGNLQVVSKSVFFDRFEVA